MNSKGIIIDSRYKAPPMVKAFTQSDLDYLIDNRMSHTVNQMADILKFRSNTIRYWIKKYQLEYKSDKTGKRPYTLSKEKREKIAMVLNEFSNSETKNMIEISKKCGLSTNTISTYISRYYFYKRSSEDTETITLKSKV